MEIERLKFRDRMNLQQCGSILKMLENLLHHGKNAQIREKLIRQLSLCQSQQVRKNRWHNSQEIRPQEVQMDQNQIDTLAS